MGEPVDFDTEAAEAPQESATTVEPGTDGQAFEPDLQSEVDTDAEERGPAERDSGGARRASIDEFISVVVEPDGAPGLVGPGVTATRGETVRHWHVYESPVATRVLESLQLAAGEQTVAAGLASGVEESPEAPIAFHEGPDSRETTDGGAPWGGDLEHGFVSTTSADVDDASTEAAQLDQDAAVDQDAAPDQDSSFEERARDLDPTPALGVDLTASRSEPPEWGTRAPHMSGVHAWGHTVQTPTAHHPLPPPAIHPPPPAVRASAELLGAPLAQEWTSPGSSPAPSGSEDVVSAPPREWERSPGTLSSPSPHDDEVAVSSLSAPTPSSEQRSAVEELRREALPVLIEPVREPEPGPHPASTGSSEGSAAMEQPDRPLAASARGSSSVAVQQELDVRSMGWQPPGAPLAPAVPFDDSARVELVESLPTVDDSTPLAAEVAEDARRRISLSGKAFPRPPRTRILTVANQKGGVGKTTTTVNVAAALAQSGLTVLVLDIDPQGNASTALGIDHHAEVPSLYDVVVEDRPLAEVVKVCPDLPNLWVAPATIDLAGAEIELVSFVAREVRLKKALEIYLQQRVRQGEEQLDYVLVDCPPSLSLLTVNAFVAAREVLIPIQCEYYALEGLSQLLKHIELIKRQLNPSLHVSTIMLTMYDGRTRLSSQVADEVRAHFPDQVVKTAVPRSVRISEAPSHGQTVMTYDPASSGALSYLEAARELAEQVLTWEPTTREEQL